MISSRLSSLIRMQDPDQSRPSLKGCLLLIHLDYVSIQIAISVPRDGSDIPRPWRVSANPQEGCTGGRAPHDHSPGELRTRAHMYVCMYNDLST